MMEKQKKLQHCMVGSLEDFTIEKCDFCVLCSIGVIIMFQYKFHNYISVYIRIDQKFAGVIAMVWV